MPKFKFLPIFRKRRLFTFNRRFIRKVLRRKSHDMYEKNQKIKVKQFFGELLGLHTNSPGKKKFEVTHFL